MTPSVSLSAFFLQLAAIRDSFQNIIIDFSWDNINASIVFVFGQPCHATHISENKEQGTGQASLDFITASLPLRFSAASKNISLPCPFTLVSTMDDLMSNLAQKHNITVHGDESSSLGLLDDDIVGNADIVELPFDFHTFPLLPTGDILWSDMNHRNSQLDRIIPQLPPSLITFRNSTVLAAAIIIQGMIADAVWIDVSNHASIGELAGMAIINEHDGTTSAYTLANNSIAEALTLLWRSPYFYLPVALESLDKESFLDRISNSSNDYVLQTSGKFSGTALFLHGTLCTAYTTVQSVPQASMTIVQDMLDTPDGTLSVGQRGDDLSPFASQNSAIATSENTIAADFNLGLSEADITDILNTLARIGQAMLTPQGFDILASMIHKTPPVMPSLMSLINVLRKDHVVGIDPDILQNLLRELIIHIMKMIKEFHVNRD